MGIKLSPPKGFLRPFLSSEVELEAESRVFSREELPSLLRSVAARKSDKCLPFVVFSEEPESLTVYVDFFGMKTRNAVVGIAELSMSLEIDVVVEATSLLDEAKSEPFFLKIFRNFDLPFAVERAGIVIKERDSLVEIVMPKRDLSNGDSFFSH